MTQNVMEGLLSEGSQAPPGSKMLHNLNVCYDDVIDC